MTIPEQAVEAAARKLCPIDPDSDVGCIRGDKWYRPGIPHWKSWTADARVALEAALPLMGVEQTLPQGLRSLLEKFAAQLDAIEAGKAQADQHQRDEGFKPLPSIKDWENVRGLTIGDLRLARAVLALPHTGQPSVPDVNAMRLVTDLRLMADAPINPSYCARALEAANYIERFAAASPHTEQPQEGLGDCGLETIQALLDLLNPLHGDLDRQLFDERRKSAASEMDIPRDAEYSVNITEGQERDLTQAVLILEDRKRAAKSRPAQQAGCAKEVREAVQQYREAWRDCIDQIDSEASRRDNWDGSDHNLQAFDLVMNYVSASPPPPVAESGWLDRVREMRNAIDMIEGALMGCADFVELPRIYENNRDNLIIAPKMTLGEARRVCTALEECTRIINSEDYTGLALLAEKRETS